MFIMSVCINSSGVIQHRGHVTLITGHAGISPHSSQPYCYNTDLEDIHTHTKHTLKHYKI